MAELIKYSEFASDQAFWRALVALLAMLAAGLGSAWYMEHYGHIVTGMDNRVVWGLPHVFAILLIIAASGALNVASIASVFGRADAKPLARLSALLAIGLLIGGLVILVLDLGRPDRLIIAMTTFNFRSIFAWNVFLYTGFLAIAVAYLFVLMTRGAESLTKPIGIFALLWRFALTTGTGSIFGWLVARDAYNSAVMAPLFIALSLAAGAAVFILVLWWFFKADGRPFDDAVFVRLGRLLGLFVAATLYFTAIQHLTALYIAQRVPVTTFLLWNGGIYPALFWGVQVGLGSLVPLWLVYRAGTGKRVLVASALVLIGAAALLYVLIIGGQAFPQSIFPGYEVSSVILDGTVAAYRPRLPEALLGLGGVALGLAIALVGVRVLRILPTRLVQSDGPGTPTPLPSPATASARPAAVS